MLQRRQFLHATLAGATAVLGTGRHALAQGDAWPSRPVRIVVAWAPGGAVDTIARKLGQKLSERQAIQWMLADNATEIEVARAFLYDTLRKASAGEDPGVGTSICKLFCSEMVGRVADRSVQVHGGMGLVRGFPVERFYRDIRHYRVGEGTSEVHQLVIGQALTGESAFR